jgi:hypothetical protein
VKRSANIWVQATPDCACVFFLSQGSGAPDPTRKGVKKGSRAHIRTFPRSLAMDRPEWRLDKEPISRALSSVSCGPKGGRGLNPGLVSLGAPRDNRAIVEPYARYTRTLLMRHSPDRRGGHPERL